MTTSAQDTASVLNTLIETLKDGQNGFRNSAENVKHVDYKALFTELSAQRANFAAELQALVTSLGETAEQTGSVSATIHRGWIDLKSVFASGDEHAVLAECERGEDSAVAEYRSALEHEELPANIRAVITRQADAVKAAHDRVRDLRDANV